MRFLVRHAKRCVLAVLVLAWYVKHSAFPVDEPRR